MHAFEYHSSPSLKCRSGESIESQLHKSTNFEHCLNFSSNKTVQQTGKELKHLQGTDVESRPMWKCGREASILRVSFFYLCGHPVVSQTGSSSQNSKYNICRSGVYMTVHYTLYRSGVYMTVHYTLYRSGVYMTVHYTLYLVQTALFAGLG